MRLLRTLKFVGQFGITVVKCIPAFFQLTTGIGCKKTFELGGRTVTRPVHFNTRHHKIAFMDVGGYVSSPLTRVVMIAYQDNALKSERGFHPKGIPLSVWHEVLEFFAQEGVIVERWELKLPRRLKRPSYVSETQMWDPYEETNLSVPQHAPDGGGIQRSKSNWIQGEEPESSSYNPGFLTSAQKMEIIGKTHKLHAHEACLSSDDPNEEVVVREEDFRRIYYRRDELISESRKDRAAKSLVKAINESAEMRK